MTEVVNFAGQLPFSANHAWVAKSNNQSRFSLETSQLDSLVKPTPIHCMFPIGRLIVHQFFEALRKPTKSKTEASAWLLSTVIREPF